MGRSKKRLSKGRPLRQVRRLILGILVVVIFLTVGEVVLLRFVNPPITVPLAAEWLGSKLGSRPHKRPLRSWVPLERISANLVRAVLAGEDQRFLTHHGFDFVEMKHALEDLLSTKRVRGASTITMQTARTVFLWHGRSLLRKLAEAYYTVLIELIWQKRRILEIYLNTVDWGKGVIGAEAAARKYFGRGAGDLDPWRAALLASVLPSPYRWSPVRPNDRVRARAERILRDMDKMPLIR